MKTFILDLSMRKPDLIDITDNKEVKIMADWYFDKYDVTVIDDVYTTLDGINPISPLGDAVSKAIDPSEHGVFDSDTVYLCTTTIQNILLNDIRSGGGELYSKCKENIGDLYLHVSKKDNDFISVNVVNSLDIIECNGMMVNENVLYRHISPQEIESRLGGRYKIEEFTGIKMQNLLG